LLRGQINVELLVLAVGVLFYSISFLAFASNTTVLKARMEEIEAQRLATNLGYIINTVNRNPGMTVNVTMPASIGDKEYEIRIRNDILIVVVGYDSYPTKLMTSSVRIDNETFTQIGNDGGVYVR
jgi:hypothetical protein